MRIRKELTRNQKIGLWIITFILVGLYIKNEYFPVSIAPISKNPIGFNAKATATKFIIDGHSWCHWIVDYDGSVFEYSVHMVHDPDCWCLAGKQ